MCAQIVDLALVRAERAARKASSTPLANQMPQAASHPASSAVATASPFQFWSGATGTRYVHTIYNLFECPPIAPANYILVKRHLDGRRTVLSIGRLVNSCATINLADVRQRCAQLGANEIHVHLLAEGLDASTEIEADLRRSLVIA
jgi:hypothetical protein